MSTENMTSNMVEYTAEETTQDNAGVSAMSREEIRKGDYIVRAIAANGMIRAFAATTRELVEIARQKHNTSPVCTAALGRLLTAGSMMGSMLKGDGDLLTLTIRGDGPMQGVSVTADSACRVKGFVYNNDVWNKEKRPGKLDVGGAIGNGTLTVVRDQDFGEPYSSQVALVSGEIGDDLTGYYATSEQIPSGIGLGVLVGTDQKVIRAGGFIVQLMPGFSDEVVDKLEARLTGIESVTQLLEKGMMPEDILEMILGDMDLEITDVMPTTFYCNCSKERVSRVLVSLGSKELKSLIEEGNPVELVCQHCSEKYTFTIEELKGILLAAQAGRLKEMGVIS